MNEGSVSKTSTIQVADVPPTVSSLNLQTGYADGQSVTLAPSVYSPLPEAPGGLNYQWTILKDGQPFATANTPTYTFTPAAPTMTSDGAPVPDVYQVSLTVSDNYGGSVTASGSFGTYDPNNIVVTTTQDLTQASSVTSLRVAIQEAESNPGEHYVKFASDLAGQTISLTNVGDSSDDGNSAIRIPSGTVVLDASNAPGVTIAASGAMRIFYVPQGTTLELEDLNLSGGDETGDVTPEPTAARSMPTAPCTPRIARSSTTRPSLSRRRSLHLRVHPTVHPAERRGGAVYVSPTGLFRRQDHVRQQCARHDGVHGAADYGGIGTGGAIYNLGNIDLTFDTGRRELGDRGGGSYDYASGGRRL